MLLCKDKQTYLGFQSHLLGWICGSAAATKRRVFYTTAKSIMLPYMHSGTCVPNFLIYKQFKYE